MVSARHLSEDDYVPSKSTTTWETVLRCEAAYTKCDWQAVSGSEFISQTLAEPLCFCSGAQGRAIRDKR
jgi:hypothetical protein